MTAQNAPKTRIWLEPSVCWQDVFQEEGICSLWLCMLLCASISNCRLQCQSTLLLFLFLLLFLICAATASFNDSAEDVQGDLGV